MNTSRRFTCIVKLPYRCGWSSGFDPDYRSDPRVSRLVAIDSGMTLGRVLTPFSTGTTDKSNTIIKADICGDYDDTGNTGIRN